MSHNGGNAIGSLRLGKYTSVKFCIPPSLHELDSVILSGISSVYCFYSCSGSMMLIQVKSLTNAKTSLSSYQTAMVVK